MNLSEAVLALSALAATAPARAGRVHLAIEGRVGRIVLDNPGSRNAMTLRMMADLASQVQAALDQPLIAVSLHGSGGRSFCAGGQLDELIKAVDRPEAARQMCLAMGTVLDALWSAPFLTFAAVDGPAIGGGAEVVTACDFPVIGASGSVHFAQVGLGLPAGWGGIRRLVERLGRTTGLELALSDVRLSGAQVEKLGLGRAAAESAEVAVSELVTRYGRFEPSAVRAIKEQVIAASAGDRARDADAFAASWGTAAHRAALAARWPKAGP